MILTQEQLDQATIKIESHLADIGIQNQFSLNTILEKEENDQIRVFIYEISNPSFSTFIHIEFDFSKDSNQSESNPSFSWMDYKKITE